MKVYSTETDYCYNHSAMKKSYHSINEKCRLISIPYA